MSTKKIIQCPDGQRLTTTFFSPKTTPLAAVMIAPATGIKQRFYAHFAQYLADNGFAVMTFDNRGIGESLFGDINDHDASLVSWGQLDMPTVLTELMSTYPDTSYHLVGHSAGGQLFGLMDNAEALTSVFNFACSSGWIKNLPFPHSLSGQFFLNFFIPLSNFLFGHTKSSWVGMGESLPKNVASQWRQWCNHGGYVKTAFGKSVFKHQYDELNMPSIWLNASDDYIAVNDNVADMISVFKKLQHTTVTLNPKDHHLASIGHMNFFRRSHKVLWPMAKDWLTEHSNS